jgi:hypothetical protein
MAHGLFVFQTIDLLAPCPNLLFLNPRLKPGAIFIQLLRSYSLRMFILFGLDSLRQFTFYKLSAFLACR